MIRFTLEDRTDIRRPRICVYGHLLAEQPETFTIAGVEHVAPAGGQDAAGVARERAEQHARVAIENAGALSYTREDWRLVAISEVTSYETEIAAITAQRAAAASACGCATLVPGALWPWAPNGDDSLPWVERCDECQVFDSDEAAAQAIAEAIGARVMFATADRGDELRENLRPFVLAPPPAADLAAKRSAAIRGAGAPCTCGYAGPQWDGATSCAHCGGTLPARAIAQPPYPSDFDVSGWTPQLAWTYAHLALGVLLDQEAVSSELSSTSDAFDEAVHEAADEARHLYGP